jgi:NitT/TauT family transport system permease protein
VYSSKRAVAEPVQEPPSKTAPNQPKRIRRNYTLVYQILLGLVLLLVWEGLSGRLMDAFWFSKPSLIWSHLVTDWKRGILVNDFNITMRNTMIGYALGASFGVVLGFILANMRRVAEILNPYIIASYGIPRIALAPLFIIWFGIGHPSKIFLAALMAFFLTFFNTYTGVRSVEPALQNIARVMGASQFVLVYKVVFPAASPWIIAGLRISIPQALVSAVVGEFMAANAGLGFRIAYYANTFNSTGTMAGILVLMTVVLVLNYVLDKVENYVLRWRPSEGSGLSKS